MPNDSILRNNEGELSWPRVVAAILGGSAPVIAAIAAVLQVPFVSGIIGQKILPGTSDVGLVAIYKQSNDFLSAEKGKIKDQIVYSKDEIWMVGTSFYISVPQFEDYIIESMRKCVKFNFVILDPNSPDFNMMSKSMGYEPERLHNIMREGILALRNLENRRQQQAICSPLSVWLTTRPFSSRIYMFDPYRDTGYTYLIPQVYGRDSTKMPGFLFSNAADKWYQNYLDGVKLLINSPEATELNKWISNNQEYFHKK
jgi:hypothetical protein